MAPFVPLIPPQPLPGPGVLIEHATLDAKAKADLTKPFHLAKDVAAFANHLGGNLLIGVPETQGVLGAPVPMTREEATKVRDAFSKEASTRCFPPPQVDFAEYEVSGGYVVAVVVYPYVGQIVGVRCWSDKSQGGYGGEAYAFPVRVGTDAVFLKPEQLSMFMLPEYRRIVIALSALQVGDLVDVHGVPAGGRQSLLQGAAFGDVDQMTNTLTLAVSLGGRQAVLGIPIDHVKTAWRSDDLWHIAVRGSFTSSPPTFVPFLE